MSDSRGPDRPRGPGRPRKDEPLSPVTAWVPTAVHNRLIQIAKQQDQSVSGLMRQLVILTLR